MASIPSSREETPKQQQNPTSTSLTLTTTTTTTSSSSNKLFDDLRQQLLALDTEGHDLQDEELRVEAQLTSVRQRIVSNVRQIRQTMKELDVKLMEEEQRAEGRVAVQDSGLANINTTVIEGLCRQMRQDTPLKAALLAMTNDRETAGHTNKLALALLTEMAGGEEAVSRMLKAVAARVLEFDDDEANQGLLMGPPAAREDGDNTSIPENIDPALRGKSVEEAVVATREAVPTSRLTPLAAGAMRSPSIKSEASSARKTPGSVSKGINPTKVTPAMYAKWKPPPPVVKPAMNPPVSPSNTTPATAAPTSPSSLAEPAEAADQPPPKPKRSKEEERQHKKNIEESMARWEQKFPGLMASVQQGEQSVKFAKPRPKRPISPPNPDANPGATKPNKKLKMDKPLATSPAFAQFLQKLSDMHHQGESIGDLLQCSKCHEKKRDTRVLNCLHLYCQKCVVALRTEAEKGDAVLGFRAFCVVQGCNAHVSGKTLVVDEELIKFLTWYDTQPVNVPSGPAQLQVVKAALEKFPGDREVEQKLANIQRGIKALKDIGEPEPECDLLLIAKLARKPW